VLLQGGNLHAHENGSGEVGGNSGGLTTGSLVAGFIEWFERYATPRTRADKSSDEAEITPDPAQGKSSDGTWYGVGYETRMKSGVGSGGGPVGGSGSGAGDGC